MFPSLLAFGRDFSFKSVLSKCCVAILSNDGHHNDDARVSHKLAGLDSSSMKSQLLGFQLIGLFNN